MNRQVLKYIATFFISSLFLAIIFSPVSPASGVVEKQQSVSGKGYVVFTSEGLPIGNNFTVEIDNKNFTSAGCYLNISLPYGDYTFVIKLPYDFSSNITKGQVTITSVTSYEHFSIHYRSYDLALIIFATIISSLIAILIVVAYYIKSNR